MAPREKRHAARSRFRPLRWVPEALVALVVVAAMLQVQFDLGHRWFGLERADPATDPASVAAPAGLDLETGSPEPPLAEAVTPGVIDAGAVRQALRPILNGASLGPDVALRVIDLSNGSAVFARGSGSITPASTMKLLTAAAALQTLEPTSRFSTKVVARADQIVLVGGGDPYLASSPARARGQYPVRADIGTLARRTAVALKSAGITRVRLGYDASLFSGPAVNPRWPASYLPDNVVPPITALWVDQGRTGDGRYAADPAREAATEFAAALASQKIAVRGAPTPMAAPATATEVAEVRSATVGEIVEQTLAVSDNNAAEVLARHIGAAGVGEASFRGGMRAIFASLKALGVDVAGSVAYDGSGLSRENDLTAETIVGVLQVAASLEHPRLRQAVSGLPVAGFSGSLENRFDGGPLEALGRVRAKTGTLTGVHGLAGIAADLNGNLMAFVFLADQVAVSNTLAAQRDLDRLAAALGACECGV